MVNEIRKYRLKAGSYSNNETIEVPGNLMIALEWRHKYILPWTPHDLLLVEELSRKLEEPDESNRNKYRARIQNDGVI